MPDQNSDKKELSPEELKELYRKLINSTTHRNHTRLNSGLDCFVFSMIQKHQLDYLMTELDIQAEEHVLDIGCSYGSLTHYIFEYTDAHVCGMDQNAPMLELGQEEFKDSIQLFIGNYDTDPIPQAPYDVILSIDALYFSKDLPKLIAKLKRALKPGGRMGFFWSEVKFPNPDAPLDAANTRLAEALEANQLDYRFMDYTKDEHALWFKKRDGINKIHSALCEEGLKTFADNLKKESEGLAKLAEKGAITRFLYQIQT